MKTEIVVTCGGRRTGTTLLAAVLAAEEDSNALGPEAQLLTRFLESYAWSSENYQMFGSCFFKNRKRFEEFHRNIVQGLFDEARMTWNVEGLLSLKNPELTLLLPELARLAPSAHFVLMVRDPRDQICSEIEVGRRQILAGQNKPEIESRDMEVLIQHYLSYYSRVLPLLDVPGQSRITVVRYEDLVQRPSAVLSTLSQIMGRSLQFDPSRSWARVSSAADLQGGPSSSPRYGQPVSVGSVGRFRCELSGSEIDRIERIADSFFARFGYSAEERTDLPLA